MGTPIDLALNIGGYLMNKRIRHMIVHVTNNCNFRCKHCFIDFDDKKDLTLDHYKDIAKDQPEVFWLDIGGGEPFLRSDLADIVCLYNSKVTHIPTNGRLTPTIVDQCKKIKDRKDTELIIGLSLDGLEETHNHIRGKKNSWFHAWNTYDKLRELGNVSIKVTTVITESNFHEILPLMEEVQKRGVDFHSVILLRGEPLDPTFGLPPLEELKAFAPKMFDILARYDYGRTSVSAYILRNFHKYLWNTSIKVLEERRQVIPCLAGEAHMVVWGDGGVSSCEMLPKVGSVRDKPLKEVLASKIK